MSVLEVNLGAIERNMSRVRQIVGPSCQICPIVKADAYGLGARRVARRLQTAGADMLAVFSPAEAAEIFAAAVSLPVLVLMPVRDVERADEIYRGLINGKLQLTVHDQRHLEELTSLADRYGTRVCVHVEVDTGMSRGGCFVDEVPAILERIKSEPRLILAGVFTHFTSADCNMELTGSQLAEFDKLLFERPELFPPQCIVHAASTYAMCRQRRFHKSMVRVGLAWAGYGTEMMQARPVIEEARSLEPSVTWRSELCHLRSIPEGRSVGYGGTWTAKRDTQLGIIPVGYADGYPYALGGRDESPEPGIVQVLVETEDGLQRSPVPIVGTVNMDQMMVDLTDLPELCPEGEEVGVGTEVELISPDPDEVNHLTSLATRAKTLPHDLLTGISSRVHRHYVEPSVLIETKPDPIASRSAVTS